MGQSPEGSSYNEDGIGTIFYQGSTDFGIRFPNVRMYTTKPTRFAKIGDILMSVRAPVGAMNIANSDCCIGRGLSAMNSKIGSITHLYYTMDYFRHTFENKNAVGTTFGSITKDELYNLPVVIPSKEVISAFNVKTIYIFNQQLSTSKEIQELTALRDSLLPLLMNGQVTLNSCLSEQHFYLFVKFNLWEVEGVCNMNAKTQIIEKLQEQLIKTLDAEKANRICRILDEILAEFSICKISKRETKTDLLLDDFIQAKKLEGCSAKTLAYYKSTLEKLFISSKKIATEISSEDIRTYLSNFQTSRQVSKMTIDNNRRIFSTFFSWLENEDLIIKSPMRKIHKVKQDITVQKVFTDENMVILRDNCMDARSKALVDLLESTGMRVGELVKLNRTDIDFEQRQTIVIGKGSKEREVYFNASAKLHLKEYLNSRIDDSPALFVQKKAPYNRLSISGIESSLRKLGQCANINKVHPHRFRRTMATEAINRGMPIEQVQRLLGHAKIDTTMRYAQVDQQNVKMSHRKYLG